MTEHALLLWPKHPLRWGHPTRFWMVLERESYRNPEDNPGHRCSSPSARGSLSQNEGTPLGPEKKDSPWSPSGVFLTAGRSGMPCCSSGTCSRCRQVRDETLNKPPALRDSPILVQHTDRECHALPSVNEHEASKGVYARALTSPKCQIRMTPPFSARARVHFCGGKGIAE